MPKSEPTQSLDEWSHLGKILRWNDLRDMPSPAELIEGLVTDKTTVVIIGETGTNKSFLAVGIACSAATGRVLLGHQVMRRGEYELRGVPVLYVVGEGGNGIGKRARAWAKVHGLTRVGNLHVFVRPKSIRPGTKEGDEFWRQLHQYALTFGIRLVVFDTYSSLAAGADETAEAAAIISAMGGLVELIEGPVILVHHTGWNNKDRGRGGSQFEYDADEVLVLQKKGEGDNPTVEVWRKKVKDGPNGYRFGIRRQNVVLGRVVDPKQDSCVLELCELRAERKTGSAPSRQSRIIEKLVKILDEQEEPINGKALDGLYRHHVTEAGIKNMTDVHAALAVAVDTGEILMEKGRGTEKLYRIGHRVSDVSANDSEDEGSSSIDH